MAFQGYGGYIWSGQDNGESFGQMMLQGAPLGAAVAAIGGGLYAASRTQDNGRRAIDTIAAASRDYGNRSIFSPFEILNTFRAPEWLSPLTSPVYKNMTDTGATYEMSWTLDLENKQARKETFTYLKKLAGKSTKQMQDMGLHYGHFDGATSLVYEQAKDAISGSLYIDAGGSRTLLSDDIMLMAGNLENDVLPEVVGGAGARPRGKLNRALHGVMSAMGLFENPGFTGEEILRYKQVNNATGKMQARVPAYIPVPSITGATATWGDLAARTSYARGVAAFEIDRFSRVTSGAVSNVVSMAESFTGTKFADKMRSGLGLTGEIKPGTTLQRVARIGGLGIKVGAGIMAIQQADWIRRNYGAAGEVIASGGIAGAAGYLVSKAGGSPKTAMMAAVGSFFGQLVLPGFDQGIWPGLVSTYKNFDLLSAANPVSYYRRTLEGFSPGITDWKTGALAGVGALAAAYATVPGVKGTIASNLLDKFGAGRLGLKHPAAQPFFSPKSKKARYWDEVASHVRGRLPIDSNLLHTRAEQQKALGALRSMYPERAEFHRTSAMLWGKAEDVAYNFGKNNAFNEALASRLDEVAARYSGPGVVQRVQKQAVGMFEQARHAFFGADPSEMADVIRSKGFVGGLGRAFTVFAGAMAGHALLTGWPVASVTDYDTLSRQYSGEELVEVKKSRFWEGGGIGFEGGNTSYFRPHYYRMTMDRVREKGIWGANEDDYSPIGKWLRKNFTYQLEEENYYDRPYPITSQAFSDIPVIGPILGNSIGQLFKPAKLMHVSEWARPTESGGYEFASVFKGSRMEPSYELGALGPGVPSTPYGFEDTVNQMRYQMRELAGLTGWARNVFFKTLTGEEIPSSGQRPELQSSSAMTSPLVQFWEANMGGALFMNEAVRRMLPSERSQIEKMNPILNNMPSWMPDKFHYGDPYRLVEWGEARMPGSGFAAMHPELTGVDPENYPLIARFGILADVAPFTKEFRDAQRMMYSQRQQGMTTEAQNNYIDMIDATVKQRFNLQHYEQVADDALMLPGAGMVRGVTGFAEDAFRRVAEPGEFLIPFGFRPTQKLLGDRDPINQYEFERLYGTEQAFWDKPWRDWFRPALMSSAHMLGYQGKPLWRQEADQVNQRFDQLEFVKWMRLAQQAEATGNGRDAERYYYAAASTRTGVNPQGSPLSIYWSIPDGDRQFFNAFATASANDRDRILQMVPSDQVHLYQAVWNRLDSGDPSINPAANSSKVDRQYMQAQYENLEMALPPDDWIGWHGDVDMDDIKVRYVNEMGSDLADFGLWEGNLKKSLNQPFLDGSEDFVYTSGNTERAATFRRLYQYGNPGPGGGPSLSVRSTNFVGDSVDVQYNDHRDGEILSQLGDYFGF